MPVKEMVLTREFDVPRDLVFKAWTDPKQMAKWWGPRGFTNPVCEMDVRMGGRIRIDMHGPDGTDYPMTGRFDEVVAPERLIFTCWAHCDASGKAQIEVINSVTFMEQNGNDAPRDSDEGNGRSGGRFGRDGSRLDGEPVTAG